MAYPYTNLVFEGGGVKGIAYAGALSVLEQNGILPQIKAVAGTSAGAITATLVALGYSAEAVNQLVGALNFSSFEDSEWIVKIVKDYGIHPGHTFLEWMNDRVANSPLNAKASTPLTATSTFADLKAAGGLDLHVYASDLYTHSLCEFSTALTPGVVIAEAVRASMSIPLFFNAWRFTNNNPNDHIYVDGGMVYNYPIDAFDQGSINMQTLGFRLEDTSGAPVLRPFGFGEWIHYVKNTFETLMASQGIDTHRDPANMERSVVINDLQISATDFDITKEQQQALYQQGVLATTAFLEKTNVNSHQ